MVVKLSEGKKKVNEELRNFSIVPYADEEPEDYTASSALDAIRDFKYDHRNDPHIYEIYDESDIYYDPETGEELVDESLEVGSTYDVFCFDCDRVTRQKYKGTTYATNEKMFVCTDCGSENYESEEIDESCRDLKEENSLKDGFEVKQVSFDVAVPVGTDLNVQAQSGNTKFYNALDKLLDSLGYQMAGDIINAEDMTDIYKANDYEPYFESES